jgi:TatD DNase family protein
LEAPLLLIDSHAHLDSADFDPDRAETLARAQEAGVRALLTIGTGHTLDELRRALLLSQQHDWIYAAAGIHPHDAKDFTEADIAALAKWMTQTRVLAWGEIGLDYHYDHSPRDVQAQVFRTQLSHARGAKRPIIIHCREAWDDCLRILESDWRSSGLGGILHCFGGTLPDARRGMDMGFMVSFAGNATYPKAQDLRDVSREIPLDRLLIETDCPFLAPQPKRGRRNEPAYVAEVARTLATVRNLSADEVAAATAANFLRFFGLVEASSSRPRGMQGREP